MLLVSRAASARLSGTLLRGAVRSPSGGGCRTGGGSRLGGVETHLLVSSRELNVLAAAAASASPSSTSSSGRRAFIAAPVKILHVSKPCSLHDPLVSEWLDKARRYAKVEEIRLPVNPQKARDNNDAATRAEGERVLKHVTSSDFVVLLDERGRAPSSEKLAELVAEAGERCGGGGGGSAGTGLGVAAALLFSGGTLVHAAAVHVLPSVAPRLGFSSDSEDEASAARVRYALVAGAAAPLILSALAPHEH